MAKRRGEPPGLAHPASLQPRGDNRLDHRTDQYVCEPGIRREDDAELLQPVERLLVYRDSSVTTRSA